MVIMKCPNCGVENDDNALYCYFCGRVLPQKEWNISADPDSDLKKKKSNRILKIMLGILGGLLAVSLAFLAVMIVRDNKKTDPEPVDMLELANRLYEEKDYMTAATRYELVLQDDPDNEEAAFGAAMSKLYFISEELGRYVMDEEYMEASEYMRDFLINDQIEDANELGLEFPIICETMYGKVGFYLDSEDRCYVYVGDFEDGIRSGFGCIIASDVSDFIHGTIECYAAYGQWKDDMPNGQMEVIKDSATDDHTYIKGTVKNGVWTGDVEFIGIGYSGENTFDLWCEFEDGIAVIQEEVKNQEGRFYRISKDGDDTGTYIVQPIDASDMTYGIYAYADIM